MLLYIRYSIEEYNWIQNNVNYWKKESEVWMVHHVVLVKLAKTNNVLIIHKHQQGRVYMVTI